MYTWIDVWVDWWIVTINKNWKIIYKKRVPKKKGKLDRTRYKKELNALYWWIYIEDVHSLYGMSAWSNFRFGLTKWYTWGSLLYSCDVWFVTPKERQKTVREEEDIEIVEGSKSKTDTKKTSLNCANRIFWVDDTYREATSRSYTPHDGIVDSALIAYYAYLQHRVRDVDELTK